MQILAEWASAIPNISIANAYIGSTLKPFTIQSTCSISEIARIFFCKSLADLSLLISSNEAASDDTQMCDISQFLLHHKLSNLSLSGATKSKGKQSENVISRQQQKTTAKQ